ncbi:hypothetical protein [Aquimarina sp. 2201CG14-23]|uniref:hypothetical protein n=1 Tax=Aquimarina mycalae TaxID=3040073 RepID=UPI00247821E6|nr:hypothetical protein [Aquimarina sp. 2201CG14-23]MDH7446576.1 hypothetical protein [Aquimarina sp. 2201CG14-23]
MRVLILKLGLFSIICLSILTFVLMSYGGNVDYFYEKFTTPKAKSMIIGDSRSFQGIQPSVMNEYFEGKGYDIPMLNYSFTIAQAIIGPLYNESILKKLDDTADNGIFIISITPEMLTSHIDYDNKKNEFREDGQPPHNMNFVDVNPNYEYLVKNLSFFHFKAMFRKSSTVHKDGWLEESNLPTNPEIFADWKKGQIDLFLRDREKYPLSDVRIKSLNTLIQELEKHGNVYLIRMPISKEFLGYEEKYYPGFDALVNSISKTHNVPYFDFNKKEKIYETYDGHHIDKFSGKEFTKNLCDLIFQEKNKENIQ